jgi:glycoside/pentoside/hexuronide:cation symporter, GPH family
MSRLPTRVLLAYGAPAVILSAFALTYYIYLPKFYADYVGLNLTAIGFIVLASRLWDAVTDPAIGALSDRTRSRWGRRRPWMVASSVPLGVVYYLLFAPPLLDATANTVRYTVLAFVFFLVWTTLAVPYESLGAEISLDYDERNRVFGVREGSFLIGTLIGAAMPGLFASGPIEETAAGFRILTLGYGVACVALVGVCAAIVPERHGQRVEHAPPREPLQPFPLVANRPFVILQVAYTVFTFGASLAATLLLFYVESVLGSARGPAFVALYIGLGLVFLPVWVRLASAWEKRSVWLLSLGVNTAAFVGIAFLGRGDTTLFAVLVAAAGLGLGGTIAIPPSMQADVIDYDEWVTGQRREGRFIGMWSLAKKFAMAASAGLALPVLDFFGYIEGGSVQPESTVIALRWLYVGGPVLCNVIAFGIAAMYPMTREIHSRYRAEIEARAVAP